eukprot:CAMPEP_0195287326 /NCGR_PEP_ID=MMETSP0707-20130614/4435_1 /TAXON_ID=33640 /ORGANISM="Asterionellopsis glacialis, Strain CCMP134" /LENGTH=378 /DNA_ID=CAMNT_0040347073 /DNA_START=39 /DNA_END=1171 /DNA_ORIENTATION=+
MTTNSTLLGSDLAARLQERLDSAVMSPGLTAYSSGRKIISSAIVVEDDSVDGKDEESTGTPSVGKDDVSLNGTYGTYRDYSHVKPDNENDEVSSLIAQSTTAKEPTFPVKLHMILSNPEFQDIISWLPHGRSWRILQQKAFEERVIPLYFRHGRYSSFARQVNGWGFRRVTHGSDYNSYYFEMFLRGMPHLCEKMRRLTNKDSAARKKLEDEAAPDFYALSRSHPLPENTPIPSPAIPASMAPPGVTGGSFVDMEAALMERRRAALVDRMNLLASTGQMPKDMMLASTVQMPKDVNIMPAAPSGLGFSGAPGPSSNHCFQQLVGKGNTGSQDMAQLFAMDGNNRGIFVPCMANGMTDGMVTGMTNGVANGMANGVANG